MAAVGLMSSFHWLVLLLGLGGGFSLPLGVPPLPEDPAMAKIAPEECMAYMFSAGMATPDPKSVNQTEQLLAEPEVRQMASEIERAIRTGLGQAAGRGDLPPGLTSDDIVDTVKLLLTRPVAVYVSSVQMQPGGPVIRGGAAVNLGEDIEKIKAKVEQFAKTLPAQLVEPVEIDGKTWQRLKTVPNCPVTWGFKDKYFLVGIGEDEIQAMVKRAKGTPPKWLTQLREQLPVERVSTVTFFNLKAIIGVACRWPCPKRSNCSQPSA